MRLARLKRQYLKAHFRRHSDAKLAKALGVDKSVIRAERERLGLERTAEEEKAYRDNPNVELPPFTGQLPAPAEPAPFGKLDYLTAGLAALATLIVYILTLGPTVTGEDSGELVTAAYTLGIAHPPAYPIWCLLGKAFTYIPYGTVAWRVNFMSAFFAALTVGLVCLLVIRLTRNRKAAATGALAFAFSREFWEQSVIAEVYTLNAFFIALCVLLVILWYESRNTRLLLVFALVYGLSLTNHSTMQLLGPVFVAFIVLVDRRPRRQWHIYLAMLGLCLLGLSVYLYLPIRSAANPPVDWGNPETWDNFKDVVTRAQYSFMFTEHPRSLGLFFQQCGVFLRLYIWEFSPWIAWVPGAGLLALWRRDRYRTAFLACLTGVVLFGVMLVNNFAIDRLAIWVNNVFWIPVYMMAGVFIGGAVDLLGRTSMTPRTSRIAMAAAALVLVVSPLATNRSFANKGTYYFAYDYARNVLDTLDANAIYFPTADHATFPVLYLQAVEGMRPDVTIANKYGYPEEHLYADMPEEVRGRFRKIPTEAEEQIIEDWIITHNPDRAVYFTKKRPLPGIPGAKMVNAGLLYRVVREGEVPPERDFWAGYSWHTLDEADTRGELTATMVLSDYHFAKGRALLEGLTPSFAESSERNTVSVPPPSKVEEAMAAFDASLRIGEGGKETLNNLGSVCAEFGQLEAAEKYYAQALDADPEYGMSLRNLGKVYVQTGRPGEALPLFERLLKQDPLEPEANWLAFTCLKEQGRVDDAIAQLERMATFPSGWGRVEDKARIYHELGMLYLNEKRQPAMAHRFFARSLAIDPAQPELQQILANLQKEVEMGSGPDAPLMPQDLVPGLPGMPPPIPTPQIPQPDIGATQGP